MSWTWIAALAVGIALAVVARLLFRAARGVTAARDRSLETLALIWPHVSFEREPGLVVAVAGEDRLELDYSLVLRAGLDAPDPEPRRRYLHTVLEGALVEQTDPDQVEEELDEAADALRGQYEVERRPALAEAELDGLPVPELSSITAGGLYISPPDSELVEPLPAGALLRVVFGVDDPGDRAAAFVELASEQLLDRASDQPESPK